jgi:hypothetical protein
VLDGVVGQDNPLGSIDHFREFTPKEVDVFMGRAVWAAIDGGGTLFRSPGGRAKNNRCTPMLVLSKKPTGGVSELVKGGNVTTTLSQTDHGFPAKGFK